MENPFKYSFNEKRYHTFNYYLKTTYGRKVSKVILDGGFTCPNRDGSKSTGGCIFCSNAGSGDSNTALTKSVLEQFEANKKVMDRKWPGSLYIPYFQSFSNTYGPLEKIRKMCDPFLAMDDVAEISIATRCDCLKEEVIDYLDSIAAIKPVWLELGLQTSNDVTGKILNRCYDFQDVNDALKRLEKTSVKVCLHVMDGLPFETKEDMLQTVKDISHLPFQAIKIHMLHVIKDTKLAQMYDEKPFELISREDYIDLIVRQLELLPPEIIVERLTGDPVKEDLITPAWLLNKTTILNDIDKLMRKEDTWQGKFYE
ncbi:MAG: TIGR01212 family radical SAM protein [Erysipelotrichaceae bacterium]|nr:TIGR01212 family radical SAM protein [Erysipelotrichaceae bacterium]